jgi:hypothetical protein
MNLKSIIKHDVAEETLLRLSLQFFAEGGGDGGDGGSAEATGGEAPAGAETTDTSDTPAPDGSKTYTSEDAAAVAKQFKMIPHNAVKERYKGTFDKAERYDTLRSHLGAVADKYGVSVDDPEGLANAILNDQASVRAKAQELGISEDLAATIVKADAQNAINSAREKARVKQEEYARMAEEERLTKEAYPMFDYATAAKNKAFKMLVDGGLSMKEAYEMSHHSSLSAAAMEAAKEQLRAELRAELEASNGRPREGATRATSGTSTDPANLKGKELDAFLETFLTH